ncbi:MAG: gamma-butyrobetaine hydroxylase-like domain-containing protein [Polyangiaceae bacterium]
MSQEPRLRAIAIRSPRGARVTEIDWGDGHKGIYPHDLLRGYCPCAGCQGHSGEIHFRPAAGDAELELEDIEVVGGYALALKWFDCHASGIYSFKYLRGLCQCPACVSPDRGVRPRA